MTTMLPMMDSGQKWRGTYMMEDHGWVGS